MEWGMAMENDSLLWLFTFLQDKDKQENSHNLGLLLSFSTAHKCSGPRRHQETSSSVQIVRVWWPNNPGPPELINCDYTFQISYSNVSAPCGLPEHCYFLSRNWICFFPWNWAKHLVEWDEHKPRGTAWLLKFVVILVIFCLCCNR